MAALLIGLTGLARAGKDTTANIIQKHTNAALYAFAQPIKEACKVLFDWQDQHVHGELKEVVDPHFGVSPRKAMQTLGTEWGRGLINSELWLLRAQKQVDSNERLIITDVRFNNEAEFIRNNGGIVIEIRRDNTQQVRVHCSEYGISPSLVDHVIDNNGSIEQLRSRVSGLLELIKS